MKKFMALLITLNTLLASTLAQAQTSESQLPIFATAQEAQHHCPFDFVAWLNTKSGVYNLDGEQAGDNKGNGGFVCQRDADQMGEHFSQHEKE